MVYTKLVGTEHGGCVWLQQLHLLSSASVFLSILVLYSHCKLTWLGDYCSYLSRCHFNCFLSQVSSGQFMELLLGTCTYISCSVLVIVNSIAFAAWQWLELTDFWAIPTWAMLYRESITKIINKGMFTKFSVTHKCACASLLSNAIVITHLHMAMWLQVCRRCIDSQKIVSMGTYSYV